MSDDRRHLEPDDLHPEPMTQVARWWAEAAHEAEMVVATVGAEGRPHARYVLLRGVDERGCTFFTDRRSTKGADLALIPHAALVMRWAPNRQVRVEGPVVEIDDAESDAYFAGRPRGSQLGAWASHQSHPIPDRAWLEGRVARAAARFEGIEVSRPPYWGGYRVEPDLVELWQHGHDRLHDRFRYTLDPDHPTGWRIERLSP